MQGLSYLMLEKLVKKQSKCAMENLFREERPVLRSWKTILSSNGFPGQLGSMTKGFGEEDDNVKELVEKLDDSCQKLLCIRDANFIEIVGRHSNTDFSSFKLQVYPDSR